MKTTRSVMGALLTMGAISALTLGAMPVHANDATTKMKSDGTMADHDSRSVSDKVSDQALETKVKTALIADNRVKARKIEVEVRNKAVYLSGMVNSQAEADAAIATARKVSGVGVVNSKLTVGMSQ